MGNGGAAGRGVRELRGEDGVGICCEGRRGCSGQGEEEEGEAGRKEEEGGVKKMRKRLLWTSRLCQQ